jgi:hypothetical protein
MMRNKLLATVAMTALIGCTSFAAAQNREGGAMQSQGAQQHQMGNPGGAMSTPSGGSAQSEPTPSKTEPKSEPGKGFSQEEHNKSSTKPQGTAQEQRGPQNQRGAQEQRGKEEQRGAQNQRGTEQRGAQDNDRTGTQERTQERMGQDQDRSKQDQDRGKAVPGQAQQSGPSGRSGGASVQLSQEQRTKIRGVIVGDRNVARVDHADFNIRVGVAVPRTVHVAVLPPEVVTIVPEYRGFEYVVVGDQLLIIDPNTLEIVAILPA